MTISPTGIEELRGLVEGVRLPLSAIETADYAEIYDEDGIKVALTTQPALIVAAVNALPGLLALADENAGLRAALEPFAREADAYSPEQNAGHVFDDDERVDQVDHLRVRDLRLAARTLHESDRS